MPEHTPAAILVSYRREQARDVWRRGRLLIKAANDLQKECAPGKDRRPAPMLAAELARISRAADEIATSARTAGNVLEQLGGECDDERLVKYRAMLTHSEYDLSDLLRRLCAAADLVQAHIAEHSEEVVA